jgi:hypothetical protein
MFVREGKHAEVLDRQREREKDCLEWFSNVLNGSVAILFVVEPAESLYYWRDPRAETTQATSSVSPKETLIRRIFLFEERKKQLSQKRLQHVLNQQSSNVEVNTWQYLRWASIIRVLKSLSLPLNVIGISHNRNVFKSILRLFLHIRRIF